MTKKLNNPAVILFPVADVQVDREVRQRTAPDDRDIESLAEDMQVNGQLHPITIRENGVLVAGERRLLAAQRNGWGEIRAQIFERLDPVTAYRIELSENLKRRNLIWQDEVRAVGVYHSMKLQTIGPMWTALGTANDLGWSETKIQRYLLVFKHMSDAEVMGAQTFEGAFNLIKGRAERARAAASNRGLAVATAAVSIPSSASPEQRGEALSSLISGGFDGNTEQPDLELANIDAGLIAAEALALSDEAESSDDGVIITADFLTWIEAYDGPAFDVLHLDFPYGKGYSGSNTRRTGRAHVAPTYADDPDIYWELLEAFITWQDKIAYPIAHLMFWFDMEHYAGTVETLSNAGWKLVQPHPLIWHKPYQGVAADTRRRPRHTYETALLLSRGDRKIVNLEQDVFVGRVEEKLHINQKSEEMLKQFLGLIVDEHSAVLDPTCGSGSALAVARALGAKRILGVELDEENAKVARYVVSRQPVIGVIA